MGVTAEFTDGCTDVLTAGATTATMVLRTTMDDRLSFDLFEKRFAVYEAVQKLINAETVHGGANQEDLNAFYDGIRGAEFLFDGNTRNFVMNIGDMAWRARIARAWLDRQPGSHPQADRLIDEEGEIVGFLLGESQTLENMFRPYLDLSRAGLRSWWPW
jgi:hypothetical protein